MEKVILDGKEVSKEELKKVQESLKSSKSKIIKEISPNNYKTLERMNG